MNVGVNFLREHMDDSDRIHYAFIDAGGPSANVVQPTAELYYIVRSPTVARMRKLYERVKKVAQGAALMTETEVEIEFEGGLRRTSPEPHTRGAPARQREGTRWCPLRRGGSGVRTPRSRQ